MSSASLGGHIDAHEGPLPADVYAQLNALAALAENADGHPPFSDQTLVSLRAADAPSALLTVSYVLDSEHRSPEFAGGVKNDGDAHPGAVPEAGNVAGMAVVDLDQGVMELVVSPCFRNEGVAGELLSALKDRGVERVQAWSHGDHPAAATLAAQHGYAPVRELWRMRLTREAREDHGAGSGAGDLGGSGTQAVETQVSTAERFPVPAGVVLRTFVPGSDDAAWVEANAMAFAEHPEQGALTVEDLRSRMSESWFDPSGFFVAERDGEILGYHWTKVHPGTDGHPDVGEVYVLGVVPSAQGSGVGKALLAAGLEYLHQRGLEAIMLYVDSTNAGAINLYRNLGFVRWDVDVMYAAAGKEKTVD